MRHNRPNMPEISDAASCSPAGVARTLPALYGLIAAALAVSIASCGPPADRPAADRTEGADRRIRVLLDTDANNELDDQHAIAYMLFNGHVFDVEGITVNRTRAGGGIEEHYAEAERVVRLANLEGRIPLYKGADGSFDQIRPHLDQPEYDGADAVRFIIERAHADDPRPLVLLPVGKLTNIALALAKDPSIADRVRIVWLGSNYPKRGEYNKENDPASLTYILDETDAPFEIVTVRYGDPSGTDAVRATPEEIRARMPGTGPRVSPPVTGREGGAHETFGDYSVALFENIELYGDPPSRALFDMAAVAIVKNPAWATARPIRAPRLTAEGWEDRPGEGRTITLWEHFDRDAIMNDFYQTMEHYQLAR
jgi:purine nucleosidase